jgi:tRNA(Ile)-lysidine synthase
MKDEASPGSKQAVSFSFRLHFLVILSSSFRLHPSSFRLPKLTLPSIHLKISLMKGASSQYRKSRPRVSDFASQLLSAWRNLKLPVESAPVIVAVSGGADSTSLLLAIDELIEAGKLSLHPTVAHLDHGLRKVSRHDATWVERLARDLGYDCVTRRVDIKKRADRTGDNLEQAARRARYEFLGTTAREKGSNLIVTAHTLDDQAETVLLRLLRGSAAEGLSGIEPVRALEHGSPIQLARPVLSWARRVDCEAYCRKRNIDFRVDEMNQDERFARVRVRKQLLPLMASFNNRIVEALSRTATLLSEDTELLTAKAEDLLKAASANSSDSKDRNRTKVPPLNVNALAAAPAAVRRRALRQWILQGQGDLRRLEMVHLAAVDRLIQGSRGGRIVELPNGARVLRKRGWLELNGKSNKK